MRRFGEGFERDFRGIRPDAFSFDFDFVRHAGAQFARELPFRSRARFLRSAALYLSMFICMAPAFSACGRYFQKNFFRRKKLLRQFRGICGLARKFRDFLEIFSVVRRQEARSEFRRIVAYRKFRLSRQLPEPSGAQFKNGRAPRAESPTGCR